MASGALFAAEAEALTIGMYADEQCSTSCLAVPFLGERFFTIRAQRDPGETFSLQGAHLRVSGIGWGWQAWVETFPDESVIVGDLLSPGGGTIILEPDRTDDCVRLCRVVLRNTNARISEFRVEGSEPPFGGLDCPVFWSMDPQNPARAVFGCARGGVLTATGGSDCATAVSPTPWSHVKSIYRR